MEKLMRQQWWKVLSVVILVYALVAGLLVPLKPNLISVTPAGTALGETVSLDLLGYNTNFLDDAGLTKAWLKLDDEEDRYALRASRVNVIDDRRATATFTFPEFLPDADRSTAILSLIVSGPANGTFVYPSAVTVRQAVGAQLSAPYAAEWARGNIVKGDLIANTAFTFPYRALLSETIRNTYFHVSLWFAMMFLLIAAVVYAIRYLRLKSRFDNGLLPVDTDLLAISRRERADHWSVALTAVGMLFGILGLLTGAVWAKYTWGSWWNWDIKQFTTLIALLIYGGYFALRAAFPDPEQRARLGAVYNVFAFSCLIPLIYVLPRLSATSLHPGAEGNPALGGEDLDSTMRMIFYPTIIGWTLFGGWMAGVAYRARILSERLIRLTDSGC